MFELLTVNDATRTVIHDGAGEEALRAAAQAAGMKSLREDGMRWVEAGMTSMGEVWQAS